MNKTGINLHIFQWCDWSKWSLFCNLSQWQWVVTPQHWIRPLYGSAAGWDWPLHYRGCARTPHLLLSQRGSGADGVQSQSDCEFALSVTAAAIRNLPEGKKQKKKKRNTQDVYFCPMPEHDGAIQHKTDGALRNVSHRDATKRPVSFPCIFKINLKGLLCVWAMTRTAAVHKAFRRDRKRLQTLWICDSTRTHNQI